MCHCFTSSFQLILFVFYWKWYKKGKRKKTQLVCIVRFCPMDFQLNLCCLGCFFVDGFALYVWLLDAWISSRFVYSNHTHRLPNLLHHCCAAFEMQQLKKNSCWLATNSKIRIIKQLWQVCLKRNEQFVAPFTKHNDHIQCTIYRCIHHARPSCSFRPPFKIINIFF